jgi:hypothetical protein
VSSWFDTDELGRVTERSSPLTPWFDSDGWIGSQRIISPAILVRCLGR